MKRAVLALFLLAGCAHRQPEVQIHEVHVPVPMPVACVDRSKIPPEPKRVSRRFTGDAKHDLSVLAPNAKQLREWGQQLRRMLDKCASTN